MSRRTVAIRKAIIIFLSLTIFFTVGALVLAIRLPGKVSSMNEVKAAVVELETSKIEQTESLKKIKDEMTKMNDEVKSLEEALQEVKSKNGQGDGNTNQEEDFKYAYLTFDDGPSDNTIKILDFLKANHIKATFFVIGKEGYDDVYKRIVDEGHTLAIHSNTHKYDEIYVSVYAFMKDIGTLADKLENITGVRPTIMRFPGGSNNTVSHKYGGTSLMDKLVGEVTDAGYLYYDWNVDSTDASSNNRPKDAIFNAVMNGVEGKEHAIILMHDAAAKKSTVEALPQIVEGLRTKGYVFAPITEETKTVQFNKQ